MAKKVASFADKLKKMQGATVDVCPVCNAEIQRVMAVKSVKNENSKGWRFNQTMVNVCKCNEKEIYPA